MKNYKTNFVLENNNNKASLYFNLDTILQQDSPPPPNKDQAKLTFTKTLQGIRLGHASHVLFQSLLITPV